MPRAAVTCAVAYPALGGPRVSSADRERVGQIRQPGSTCSACHSLGTVAAGTSGLHKRAKTPPPRRSHSSTRSWAADAPRKPCDVIGGECCGGGEDKKMGDSYHFKHFLMETRNCIKGRALERNPANLSPDFQHSANWRGSLLHPPFCPVLIWKTVSSITQFICKCMLRTER